MSTPLTASGKPCKLCIAKGSNKKCHLHSSEARGSPNKKSPKRSPVSPSTKPVYDLDDLLGKYSPKRSPKRSPEKRSPKRSPKKSPTRTASPGTSFDNMPKDVLKVIMLEMPREKLNIFCRTHGRAAEICRSTTFRNAYRKKHSFSFLKNLKYDPSRSTYDARIYRNSKIELYVYYKNGKITSVNLNFPDRKSKIVLSAGENSQADFSSVNENMKFLTSWKLLDQLEKMLISIDKQEWLPNVSLGPITAIFTKGITRDLKNEVMNALTTIPNGRFSLEYFNGW